GLGLDHFWLGSWEMPGKLCGPVSQNAVTRSRDDIQGGPPRAAGVRAPPDVTRSSRSACCLIFRLWWSEWLWSRRPQRGRTHSRTLKTKKGCVLLAFHSRAQRGGAWREQGSWAPTPGPVNPPPGVGPTASRDSPGVGTKPLRKSRINRELRKTTRANSA